MTSLGVSGFYIGWFPALVQKIPSYALTWMFFQQIKLAFLHLVGRVGNTLENTLFGAAAVLPLLQVRDSFGDVGGDRLLHHDPGGYGEDEDRDAEPQRQGLQRHPRLPPTDRSQGGRGQSVQGGRSDPGDALTHPLRPCRLASSPWCP